MLGAVCRLSIWNVPIQVRDIYAEHSAPGRKSVARVGVRCSVGTVSVGTGSVGTGSVVTGSVDDDSVVLVQLALVQLIADDMPELIFATECLPKAQVLPIDHAMLDLPKYNFHASFDAEEHGLVAKSARGMCIYVSEAIQAR